MVVNLNGKHLHPHLQLFPLVSGNAYDFQHYLLVLLHLHLMGKSYYSGGGKRGMARRISWDEPCLTLTCSPSQKQTERCHPDETRPFTVREYARIQSFPDSWEFSGGIGEKYKQIGNAVPVELARRIGLELIKSING